ncbi:uncharacterized protein LOC101844971 [Aplysia californica]|uniref:Uncharacterized protein LOC101844971 n=1 Tax=Aplysia californica TaxID=6500 RepID=A0ABM0JCW4_APLCA|nr:uncharacterized protein LOC101844971 [Aplysia californica]
MSQSELHVHNMVSLRTSLTLAVTFIATVSLVSIDAKRVHVAQRQPQSISNGNIINKNNNNNNPQGYRLQLKYKVTRLNTSASAVVQLPEATTSLSGLRSAIVLSNSKRTFQSLTSQPDRTNNERGAKRIPFSSQKSSHGGLQLPKGLTSSGNDVDGTSRTDSSLSRKSSSLSQRQQRRRQLEKRRRRRRRRKNRRDSRRKSNSRYSNRDRDAKRRKKLRGISKLVFQRLSANSDKGSSRGTQSGSGRGKDSSRRRKGRKKSKNKKIVIAEQVNFPPLKERCKTQPMQQEIRVEGCSAKSIMNNFCYGTCISVYIPEARGTGDGDPSFVSCGFCRPRDVQHISVQLRCRSRNGRVRLERRRVPYVKECRCMAQKVQL